MTTTISATTIRTRWSARLRCAVDLGRSATSALPQTSTSSRRASTSSSDLEVFKRQGSQSSGATTTTHNNKPLTRDAGAVAVGYVACLPGWTALLIATPVLGAMAALHALDGRRISACGDPTAWLTMQSDANQSPNPNSLITGKLTGNFENFGLPEANFAK